MKPLNNTDIASIFIGGTRCLYLSDEQWEYLILVLRHQQLLARASLILKRRGIREALPGFVQRHLRNAEILAEKQHRQIVTEATFLREELGGIAQHLVFLKGAGYVLSGSDAALGRTFSDIDLLVDKAALPKIEQKLGLHGWLAEEITEYDDQYYRNWAHEIPPLRHGSRGTVLDVHHNIVPPVSRRAPEVSLLWAQVVTTEDGFQVLSPHAMVLHSAIHLLMNEEFGHGFRDLLDIHLLIQQHNHPEFWKALAELAQSTGFEWALFLVLRYREKILGVAPPVSENPLLPGNPVSRQALALSDFVFSRVLQPVHPSVKQDRLALANALGFLRGHWLKMPLPVLLFHTVNKLWRGAVEGLLGPTFFLKDEQKSP